MASVEKYYEILGVSQGASLQEIIGAYRKKAMELHPDRNKAPNATQQFILLEEAYKYLRNLKEGKISSSTGDKQYDEFVQWWAREQENTRQRAQERARMRYEEYINSDEYKMETADDHFVNIFFGALTLLIIVVIPVWSFIAKGFSGLGTSLFFVVITLPITLPVLSQLPMLKKSLAALPASLTTYWKINREDYTSRAYNLIVVFGSGFNIFLIFHFALNTVIPTTIIIILYALAIATALAWAYFKHIRSTQMFIISGFVVAPLLLSSLFALNYSVSFNRHKETYKYLPKNAQYTDVEYKNSNTIHLVNGEYADYYNLRTFKSYKEVRMGNEVTFVFEDGLLGFRVLKGYDIRWHYADDKY